MPLRPTEPTLGELVTRLVDNLKDYARAEVAVVKETANNKVARFKPVAIFLAVALFIAQAALTVAFVALGVALGPLVGPAGGMALSAVLGFVIVGVLAWLAVRRLSGRTA